MEQRLGGWATETVGLAWVNGWPRWRMALGTAAVRGVLCYGPPRGTEVTFVRPDQWLGTGPWPDHDPQEALAGVLAPLPPRLRPGHRPRLRPVVRPTPPAARAVQAALAGELVEVDVEGDPGFLRAADLPALGPATPQSSTCCRISTATRRRPPPRPHLPPSQAAHSLPHGQAGTVPLLLVDGVVAGVWKREGIRPPRRDPGRPVRSPHPRPAHRPRSRRRSPRRDPQATPTLTVGPITVRPHL